MHLTSPPFHPPISVPGKFVHDPLYPIDFKTHARMAVLYDALNGLQSKLDVTGFTHTDPDALKPLGQYGSATGF